MKIKTILIFCVLFVSAWWVGGSKEWFLFKLSFEDTEEKIIAGEFIQYEQDRYYFRKRKHTVAVVRTDSGKEKIDMRGMIGYRAVPSHLEFSSGEFVTFEVLAYSGKMAAVAAVR